MKKSIIIGLLLIGMVEAYSQTASVNIIRRKMYTGVYGNLKVFIDNELACRLNNNSYSTHQVPPGEHKFTVQYGGQESKENAKEEALSVTLEAGKTYYILTAQEMKGLVKNVFCQEITESSWKKMSGELKIDKCL